MASSPISSLPVLPQAARSTEPVADKVAPERSFAAEIDRVSDRDTREPRAEPKPEPRSESRPEPKSEHAERTAKHETNAKAASHPDKAANERDETPAEPAASEATDTSPAAAGPTGSAETNAAPPPAAEATQAVASADATTVLVGGLVAAPLIAASTVAEATEGQLAPAAAAQIEETAPANPAAAPAAAPELAAAPTGAAAPTPGTAPAPVPAMPGEGAAGEDTQSAGATPQPAGEQAKPQQSAPVTTLAPTATAPAEAAPATDTSTAPTAAAVPAAPTPPSQLPAAEVTDTVAAAASPAPTTNVAAAGATAPAANAGPAPAETARAEPLPQAAPPAVDPPPMAAATPHNVATPAASPAAAPVPAAPVPAAVPAMQVAAHILRAAADGVQQFNLRLDPPELGRVEVQVQVDHDGRVAAVVATDRMDTLDLLQRDARGLERALQDAGLRADRNDLTFTLRDQPGEGRHHFGRPYQSPERWPGQEDETGDLATAAAIAQARPWRALDISV